MVSLLFVDDDSNLCELVTIYFTKLNYEVIIAKDGMEAIDKLKEHTIAIAIVDVMIPYLNGYEVTEYIRKHNPIPVLLLTAKGQLDDKEKGFLAGTDDYVVKPVELKELHFRIEALLRRYGVPINTEIENFGDLKIDYRRYEILLKDRVLLLPLKEFELLTFLVQNASQVLSRQQIINKVWGIDYYGDERTVDVHIKRLRSRFLQMESTIAIKTVRGIGYSIEASE